MKAVATLGVLLVTVTVLTAVCILLPLWLTRDRVPLAGAGPLFAFFIAIGLGFMLIETSQMQRLIIALGHPTYGLSVVLFALLLSSGLGSYLTAGVTTAHRAGRRASRACCALVVVLAVFGAVTPAVARWIEPMTTPVRIAGGRGRCCFRPGCSWGWRFRSAMKLAADARARADAVVLGAERRGIGAGLGAQRLHRADVVDLDGVLDRLALLSSRRAASARCDVGARGSGLGSQTFERLEICEPASIL